MVGVVAIGNNLPGAASQRLLTAVEETRNLSTQAMCDSLVKRLTDGYDPDDDIAILVIRRN